MYEQGPMVHLLAFSRFVNERMFMYNHHSCFTVQKYVLSILSVRALESFMCTTVTIAGIVLKCLYLHILKFKRRTEVFIVNGTIYTSASRLPPNCFSVEFHEKMQSLVTLVQ